jgi:hypothetical protein
VKGELALPARQLREVSAHDRARSLKPGGETGWTRDRDWSHQRSRRNCSPNCRSYPRCVNPVRNDSSVQWPEKLDMALETSDAGAKGRYDDAENPALTLRFSFMPGTIARFELVVDRASSPRRIRCCLGDRAGSRTTR